MTAEASAVVLLIYFSVCSFPSAFLIRDLTTDYKSDTSDDEQTIVVERGRERERRDHLLPNRIFNFLVYIGENLSLSTAHYFLSKIHIATCRYNIFADLKCYNYKFCQNQLKTENNF